MNPLTMAMLLRGTLAANRVRLALTILSIALGVALAGAVHTVHTSALAEVDRSTRALAGAADLEVRGPLDGFDERIFARVAKLPGIAVASPVVEVQAPIAGSGDESVRVLGIDPLREMRLQPAFVARNEAAALPEAAALLDERSAWLSPAAAARLGLGKGAKLGLVAGSREHDFRVAGILEGLRQAGDLAVIDIAAAQQAFARVGRLSRIDLRLRRDASVADVRRELGAILPPGVVAAEPDSPSRRAAAISRAYRVNLDALALVALATGAFLVFSTLALQAARRRQEFALLRALGVTRRGLAAELAVEGALLGAAGAALGTAIGIAASRFLLARIGADLGAGYFSGAGVPFAPDARALGAIALLAVALCVAAALRVASAVGRIPVADALRDRAIDVSVAPGSIRLAAACAIVGVPLLLAPALEGLPLGGYAAIGAWLAAAVLAVAPICRAVLRHAAPEKSPLAALALAQVRDLPGHLAASVAGIVVSASLCVAMAILVFSFRVSLEDWLGGIIGADLYVRTAAGGDTGYLTLDEQRRIERLPEVKSAEALRYDRLVLDPAREPLSLIARPIDARILAGYQAEPRAMPPPGAEPPVWISEAARDLEGWKPGDRIVLAIAGHATALRVAAVIRDYARTWGAVVIPLDDYRRITGDTKANDLALHLAPGVDVERAEAALRAALPAARGLTFEDASNLRRRSLETFDRTFAVTYALEAIAVAIGLAGVTSSFAALAWSRRREFGVLRFLGLTRREILRLLALEGAAAGALGAAIGLASGILISFVLVRVVNRQSFHWSVELHWPWGALAALMAAIVLLCAAGARASGAAAVRREAVAAVKDDA
ncbi:MAG TPA: ABC transporter permease [Usitatibacter sp.]|nr:ABC transporter permease [Usitatibacter sp.]